MAWLQPVRHRQSSLQRRSKNLAGKTETGKYRTFRGKTWLSLFSVLIWEMQNRKTLRKREYICGNSTERFLNPVWLRSIGTGFAAREWGKADGIWLWSGRDELFFVAGMRQREQIRPDRTACYSGGYWNCVQRKDTVRCPQRLKKTGNSRWWRHLPVRYNGIFKRIEVVPRNYAPSSFGRRGFYFWENYRILPKIKCAARGGEIIDTLSASAHKILQAGFVL